jgi:hypothetical protein
MMDREYWRELAEREYAEHGTPETGEWLKGRR